MSDNNTQLDSELFDTIPSDDNADATTDGEASPLDLNADASTESGKSKLTQAQVQAQHQMDKWLPRYINGEEMPANLGWLKKLIEQKLESENIIEQKKPEISETIREELRKSKEQEQFDDLKGQVNSLSLTKTQKEELQKDFNSLKGKLGAYEALKYAMRANGVTDNQVNFQQRRDNLSRANVKTYQSTSLDYQSQEIVPDEDIEASLEKLANIKDPKKRFEQMRNLSFPKRR